MHKTEIHKTVAREYARMLQETQQREAGNDGKNGVGMIASLAGYEQQAQHEKVAAESFGCGNPVALAAIEAGQTVLDLGSGAGLDLILAAERVGPSGTVIGIDMTQEMVDKALENVRQAGHDNVEVRLGMIEHLPVADNSVDWVISNCVINLSPDKEQVFAEIARVLKPGGRFSISDIVVQDLPDALRNNAALYSACVAGAISEEAYLDGLRAAGLEDLTIPGRLVYDASQMVALISCEIPGLDLSKEMIQELAPGVVGKVWSAKFSGRKADRAR